MTDTSSNQSWGAFTPVMPAFVRLVAGVIVLLVVEAVVLGFPGIQQNVSGTSMSVASLIIFFIGLIVAFIVLRFGSQLASTISDAYKTYRAWTPLLEFLFQIVAIAILYMATYDLASPYFSANPWALPMIFLFIALLPTLKAVVTVVHAVEHPGSASKHQQN